LAPTNEDEAGLRQLSSQLRSGRLVVKVHLRHPSARKALPPFPAGPDQSGHWLLGSSNLTLAGLSKQGELNVDVVDSDATAKLADWFEDRWRDRWCLDISKELAEIIDQSWAGQKLVPPYHVYLKMAYHLAQEARAGLSEFRIPAAFGNSLFDFQVAAVKIAAHHLHKRGGVLIGDVVGLGKSMMATALAKVFEDDFGTETLILCPKNLVPMWEDYAPSLSAAREGAVHLEGHSGAAGKDTSLPRRADRRVAQPAQPRRQALEGDPGLHRAQRQPVHPAVRHALQQDLSRPLRAAWAFPARGCRHRHPPEKLIAHLGGEHEFIRRHQCPVRSLAAFEKSEDADDWRDLMRLYMVRRTRGFIMQHYAHEDEAKASTSSSPTAPSPISPSVFRKNLKFRIDDDDPADPYARFYSSAVVATVNALLLPRYGLGNYLKPGLAPTPQQVRVVDGLSRAGTRLMGFCRTNLFKRLESAGPAFLSVHRAAHPAQPRRPACTGERPGHPLGHAGSGTARYPLLRRRPGIDRSARKTITAIPKKERRPKRH
jgi:hypothetical protein